jgi:hypothetical protein
MGTAVALASLGLLALLLFTPLELAFRCERPAFRCQFGFRWMFGLVKKKIEPERERSVEKPRPSKPKKPRRGKRPGRARVMAMLTTRGFLRGAARLVGRLLTAFRFHDLFARLRAGFEDPAGTGLLCSVLMPAAAYLEARHPGIGTWRRCSPLRLSDSRCGDESASRRLGFCGRSWPSAFHRAPYGASSPFEREDRGALDVRYASTSFCDTEKAARALRNSYCTCSRTGSRLEPPEIECLEHERCVADEEQLARWHVDRVGIRCHHFAALPRRLPSAVKAVGSSEGGAGCSSLGLSFARPKSRSFAPERVSIMLPGLRSRCTTPLRWALSSASPISTPTRSACSGPGVPFAGERRVSRLPGAPAPGSPLRPHDRCHGGRKCSGGSGRARASRTKRCFTSGRSETCAGRTLIATRRLRRVSFAL